MYHAFHLLSLLFVGSLAVDPKPPPFTYLYTINITANEEINIGQTPVGDRAGFSYAGGNFSGPLLNGQLRSGADWGILDSNGVPRQDTVYILQTDDGADIWVRATGVGANVHHTFETGNTKYYWLNSVIGYATGGPSPGGVYLDVWQIGDIVAEKPTR